MKNKQSNQKQGTKSEQKNTQTSSQQSNYPAETK